MRHSTLELIGRSTRPRCGGHRGRRLDAALARAGRGPDRIPGEDRDGCGLCLSMRLLPKMLPIPMAMDLNPLVECRLEQAVAGLEIRSPQGGVGSSPTFGTPTQRSAPRRRGATKAPLLQAFPTPDRTHPPGGTRPPHRAPRRTRADTNGHRLLPEMLPADPALATVVNARDRPPAAVRAGIVAMVKAATQGYAQ